MAKSVKIRLKPRETASRGWKGFIGWLEATHPKVFDRVAVSNSNFVTGQLSLRNSAQNLTGLAGDDNSPAQTVTAPPPAPSMIQQFVTSVAAAASALLPLAQQQKILKLQLKRAEAGLPPLDVGAYVDPNQGINVGVTPATQKTLLYLVGGVAGVFLLSRLLKR